MCVRVVRVLDRARQGATRPFICQGDDRQRYFVKGAAAGYASVVCDWIAATLGRAFGLPIPECRLIKVEANLVRFDLTGELAELGAGVWFGSREVREVSELQAAQISSVPAELRARVLLFDWWIANGDRTLADAGGNPNLLWSPAERRLHVIDHNLAFERASLSGFRHRHIFRHAQDLWTLDFRAEMMDRMRAALASVPLAWEAMPAEWAELAGSVTLTDVRDLLWRFEQDPITFWNLR